jgi:hypothetical protein
LENSSGLAEASTGSLLEYGQKDDELSRLEIRDALYHDCAPHRSLGKCPQTTLQSDDAVFYDQELLLVEDLGQSVRQIRVHGSC